jgi:hypothetical protein
MRAPANFNSLAHSNSISLLNPPLRVNNRTSPSRTNRISPRKSPTPAEKISMLEEKIKELEDKVKKYKMKVNELKYRPGGTGYEKAKQRFREGVSKQLGRPISPKKSIKKSKAKSM